jgi:hypothetical protein
VLELSGGLTMLRLIAGLAFALAVGAILERQFLSHDSRGAPAGSGQVYTTPLTMSAGARFPTTMLLQCGAAGADGQDDHVITPVSITPRLRSVIDACYKRADIQNLQHEFALETRDGDWASLMEKRLQSYINQHAASSSLSISSIECRRTLCAIRGSTPRASGATEWEITMAGRRREAWWTFSLVSLGETAGAQDLETLLMLRRPEPVFQLR